MNLGGTKSTELRAELRRAEKLTFCMDPTLTPRNICAKQDWKGFQSKSASLEVWTKISFKLILN